MSFDTMAPPTRSNKPHKRGHFLEPSLRHYILTRDKLTCQYCDKKGYPLHVDHIHPRSLGGKDVANNLITSCPECNNAKSNRILPGRTTEQKVRNFRKERQLLKKETQETRKLFDFLARKKKKKTS